MGSQKRIKTLTDPEPVYHSNGESLSKATVDAIRQELIDLRIVEAIRSDAVSIAKNSERLLAALGYPVESAVRLRVERRRLIKRRIK